ncbi:putative iron-regulated protein [Flavobacterium sp. 90]|uniref:imelysin family protein n=1 Tax=unclassified Flavobacterium TaxID=196869 RepID=UPI000EB14DCE|nr:MULTISPECIES: imelysin family protein [unclassified Flavobacterium]RKR10280.1 putative iron-regulated protein [Flavobacterium sp. 81]TCK54065.1 putative iron-regulated protein [Flavobacterium sp. 90]
MKNLYPKVAFALFAGLTFFACSSNDNNDSNSPATKKQVIENYSNIVYANYKQAYDDAVLLETAIKTFTATPTNANFTAAKTAWKASRESYGTTEAFRFANGPIDNEELDGPEAYMNSWPLDENYIDYVDGSANAGIINSLTEFPLINKTVLIEANSGGSNPEKNISVGYHAIEFLLWGQDLTAPSAKLPGQRPYTDYVTGASGTAANQGRRADYLKACASILIDDLDSLVQQWKSGGSYRKAFLAMPEDTAIKNIYLGITTLVTAELPIERMEVALQNADQEDEHSCFSDNTHRDIALNLQGVINVYQGKYGNVEGPSLEDLVKQADAATYDETLTSLNSSTTKVAAILTPFDLAISGGPDSPEGAKVKTAVQQLLNFGATLLKGASKIGITVNG